MFRLAALALALMPGVLPAQTPEVVARTDARLATVRFIHALQDPATGGFRVTPDGKPSLRACNGAVKALQALGEPVPNADKVKAFIRSCYDPATGAFAEPGGKPDVAITSIGVMAAVAAGLPKEPFAKSMDYLKAHAKSFEDVRIAAAAVEAWGVKDCPFDLGPWFETAEQHVVASGHSPPKEDGARDTGSLTAMFLRLGKPLPAGHRVGQIMTDGQRPDGGWGKGKDGGSDQESTYRVMRALTLLKQPPADAAGVRKFLASCRNADGGYGVKPGEASSMSGVYYAAIVSKWLDGMEKK